MEDNEANIIDCWFCRHVASAASINNRPSQVCRYAWPTNHPAIGNQPLATSHWQPAKCNQPSSHRQTAALAVLGMSVIESHV